jgi:hypothetical protein
MDFRKRATSYRKSGGTFSPRVSFRWKSDVHQRQSSLRKERSPASKEEAAPLDIGAARTNDEARLAREEVSLPVDGRGLRSRGRTPAVPAGAFGAAPRRLTCIDRRRDDFVWRISTEPAPRRAISPAPVVISAERSVPTTASVILAPGQATTLGVQVTFTDAAGHHVLNGVSCVGSPQIAPQ